MRRYLVVADQTLGGEELERLREAGAEADDAVFEPMPLDVIRTIASPGGGRGGLGLHTSAAPVAVDREGPSRRSGGPPPFIHIVGPAGPSL
jgi:hypothetical protein